MDPLPPPPPPGPANLSHRVSYLCSNYNAKVALWSSHLSLSSTLCQVWLDQIMQLVELHVLSLPSKEQTSRRNALEQVSLPVGCDSTREQEDKGVKFLNLGKTERKKGRKVVHHVKIVNMGEVLLPHQHFASQLAIQAVDGLALGGKHLKVAEEAGVGRAMALLHGDEFFLGVSTVFRTSAKHVLEKGAIVKKTTALHVQTGHSGKGSPASPSISTQIAYLHNLLLQPQHARGNISVFPLGNTYAHHIAAVAQGWLPLVVRANKADVLATLVNLEKEVEKTHSF
ncbi:hypothetical protein JCM8097_006667 [Rhodosporidiobolus ruineniae]